MRSVESTAASLKRDKSSESDESDEDIEDYRIFLQFGFGRRSLDLV